MSVKSTVAVLAILLVTAVPAVACIVSFGYTGADAAYIDAISANVDTGLTHIVVTDENDYIVDDVQYMVSKAGPALVDLTIIIFNPTSATVNCTGYEYGSASETVTYTNLRGNYQSRLDTFFSVNAALFQGSRKVYGIIINNEANNRCVAAWKLQNGTSYVESKLASISNAYSPVYTIVGYDLRNTKPYPGRGGVASMGFPVAADGETIVKFPSFVDVVAYYAYDIYNPGNPSHTLNVNVDSWTTINSKLNQALQSNQKTAVVVKAFCQDNDPVEKWWGVTCPNMASWKIGQAASNWKNFALSDPRNLFVVGFNWTDFDTSYGSESLSTLWSYHTGVEQSANCSI
jgi:hypothetical protein